MNPLDNLALAALTLYQRHLSPRKDYCCAHRALHGGSSCSALAHQAIARDGLWLALTTTRNRLRACRAAAQQLSADRDRDKKRKKRGCEDCLPDICPDACSDACSDAYPDACPDACDGGSCLPDACTRRNHSVPSPPFMGRGPG